MTDTPEKLENMTLGDARTQSATSPCPPPAGMTPKPGQHVIGEIDMRIATDGTWFYMGTPITRNSLVNLFSTVVRRDTDGAYWLITPVEMARIKVEDAPFLAVEMHVTNDDGLNTLNFRTNTGRWVAADAGHPIRVDIDPNTAEPRPYLQIAADGTEARFNRTVFYELVEMAEQADIKGKAMLTLESGGATFILGSATEDI